MQSPANWRGAWSLNPMPTLEHTMSALSELDYQRPVSITANDAFQALLAEIRERARSEEFDRQKYISQDIIERFKALGVYRALVPKRFGGDERSPIEFCQMIEDISIADGSAGWVASFGMNPVYLASLPLATLEKVYANGPDVVFAGGIFPPQPATFVEGGLEVNGRWKFSSGCMGASLIGVGIAPKNGEMLGLPRLAVMPREKVKIEETWDVVGLIGTGSHDVVIDGVVVPEDWTFVRGGPANLDEPMFRYPSLSFATQVLSVVGLGVARAALDYLSGMASGRFSVTGAPALSDRPWRRCRWPRPKPSCVPPAPGSTRRWKAPGPASSPATRCRWNRPTCCACPRPTRPVFPPRWRAARRCFPA
ncbi:hypothetical protein PSm6_49270 [Pseudomonas solani]|uniref:Acyl-CoA dehydrogenase/oxidase N-terminal domain-containing protein n=1 Tax=Pseudomonas solani TaxID=2731552 RepID=A0ABM7LG62_9PSED|nr:hypothetical protein PSm6_49270 [Pseudomonas solani]